jgi:homoprotocatechuate degradation regulator HpaR
MPVPPNLPLEMLQLREEFIGRFRPILNHFGVTEQQWRILRVLRFREAMEPKEICETCLFLSPSLAGILTRMEAEDLVRKERMANDLRRVNVTMTDKGKALVDAALPLIAQQYQLLEDFVGKETLDALFNIIDRLSVLRGGAVPMVSLPKD